MKKIVITGATGMIGSSLAQCALTQGIEILCIVRKGSQKIENLPKSVNLKILYLDLEEYATGIVSGQYDCFFHLAWDKTFGVSRDDVDTQIKNIQYTMDAVKLAKCLGCEKFIGAGSQAEYGIVSAPLKPDSPVNPQSGYGIAKYTAGKLSRLLCSQLGMEHNWVRILSVYGPLDAPHSLIMYTINMLQQGYVPELTKCEQLWDYIYCDDVARALLAIGETGINGKVYPLGSGSPRLLHGYIESLRDNINPDIGLGFGKKEYYAHQPMYLCADITELTADTGWVPVVGFEDGIKKIASAQDML
jgi:nucleoside-diphosphate-sugar epimerase